MLMANGMIFKRELLKKIYAKNASIIKENSFLSDYAANLLIDKLKQTSLNFENILYLGAKSPLLTEFLQTQYPQAKITETSFSAEFLALSAHPHKIVCDEELLPFKEQSFDLVCSVLNLHNVNDLVGTLIQIRKTLKDKGLFLASLIGGSSLSKLRHACLEADAILGSSSPKVAPMLEVKMAGQLLQRAGYHMVIADSDDVEIIYEHVNKLLLDIKNMGEGNILNNKTNRLMSIKRLALIKENYINLSKLAKKITANYQLINLTASKN